MRKRRRPGQLAVATLVHACLLLHSMQHGEHVVQRQQWAKHKRIWQAEAAAQFCDHQQHVPSDTPGSPGVGDEAADEGPAVNMVQLTLPPGPDAAQAYSAIRSTLPLGHPSLVQEAA